MKHTRFKTVLFKEIKLRGNFQEFLMGANLFTTRATKTIVKTSIRVERIEGKFIDVR